MQVRGRGWERLLAMLATAYRNIHRAIRERLNGQSDWRKLLEVSFISFDDCEVMSRTFSLPLVLIIGIGLHLDLDNEITFCTLGMLAVHREDSALWITFVPSHF